MNIPALSYRFACFLRWLKSLEMFSVETALLPPSGFLLFVFFVFFLSFWFFFVLSPGLPCCCVCLFFTSSSSFLHFLCPFCFFISSIYMSFVFLLVVSSSLCFFLLTFILSSTSYFSLFSFLRVLLPPFSYPPSFVLSAVLCFLYRFVTRTYVAGRGRLFSLFSGPALLFCILLMRFFLVSFSVAFLPFFFLHFLPLVVFFSLEPSSARVHVDLPQGMPDHHGWIRSESQDAWQSVELMGQWINQPLNPPIKLSNQSTNQLGMGSWKKQTN